MLSKGRVALKIAGRDSGVCAIVDTKEDRVQVIGPSVRKRWVNPAHLEPLSDMLEVDRLSDDELVEKLRPLEETLKKRKLSFFERESIKARK